MSARPDSGREVDLWVLDEAALAPDLVLLQAALSAHEALGAAGFAQPAARRRYGAFRGALRRVLGGYLGCAPAQVALATGEFGKPHLRDTPEPLAFNLSHSGDLLVIAVSRGGALGVDIEHMRALSGRDRLARRMLGPAEQACFHALPEADRELAFWRAWTRKEAYLKGVGVGLSQPLSEVAVTLAPQEPPRLVTVAGRPQDPARWHLLEFRPRPGVLGCLATCDAPARLRRFGAGDLPRGVDMDDGWG